MNEQIRKLAEQCQGDPKTSAFETYFDKEKFAQLIIQECLAQCTAEHDQFLEVAAKNNGRESDFAFGSVNSAERIKEAIKKQFGVEQ